jgi:hypothetical protein
VADPIRLPLLDAEDRQELVLADLEERVTFTLVELLEVEDVLVKLDGLRDIVDLDRDVVDPVDMSGHRRTSADQLALVLRIGRQQEAVAPPDG